jgi:hypothetical protein
MENAEHAHKKFPCKDCKFCQWCSDERCRLCRGCTNSIKDNSSTNDIEVTGNSGPANGH